MAYVLGGDNGGDLHAPAIDRNIMAQAERLIRPSIMGVSPLQQLLSIPAGWIFIENPDDRCPESGPRLQSPRYRGVAPVYPKSDHLDDMYDGTLVVFPGGFVLEPADPCRPCTHISRSTVKSVTFYRDAFDVAISAHDRLIVRTTAVDDVDSIFQAYFWNPLA